MKVPKNKKDIEKRMAILAAQITGLMDAARPLLDEWSQLKKRLKN